MKLSVIIPVYNEERTAAEVVREVASTETMIDKEIIVVNDGSTDDSFEILKEVEKEFNNVKVYTKPNGGKGSAVKYGIKKATGDIFIIQDADFEYSPKDYDKLIKPILDGRTFVVYGSRVKGAPWFSLNFFGGLIVTLTFNLFFFTSLTDEPTCYKVFHKKLKKILVNAEGDHFDWEPEVTAKLVRLGYRIMEVPISYNPRTKKEGKKLNLIRDGLDAVKTIIKWRFKRLDL